MKRILLLLTLLTSQTTSSEDIQAPRVFTIGFITSNKKIENGTEVTDVELLGARMSAAFGLAIEDVNSKRLLPKGTRIEYIIAETYGLETQSILETAKLWKKDVSAIIGPQETCVHEARMAASFNLAMISHYCSHHETSNKILYPTFARTNPPATFIAKSVTALLLKYRWSEVAFFYSNDSNAGYLAVAQTVKKLFSQNSISIRHERHWEHMYHHGWNLPNFFEDWVKETKDDVRIYVILGEQDNHLGLMDAMHQEKMFSPNDRAEYFIVGINPEPWEKDDPSAYLKGSLEPKDKKIEDGVAIGMRHYLSVMMSPPVESNDWSYKNFTERVRAHMVKGPFSDLLDQANVQILQLRREAAYLYDAVMLYAKSLSKVINETRGVFHFQNGTRIIKNILNTTYLSALGFEVFMDANGDAEGNFSLLAFGADQEGFAGLYPVGTFNLKPNDFPGLPELHLEKTLIWTRGAPPLAVPICGFKDELCLSEYADREIVLGVVGGVCVVICVVVIVAYRNYRYEQELDSLLWKIDLKELKIDEFTPTSKAGRNSMKAVKRQSQVSLTSNQEADFRFSTIYAQIGVFRGRIYTVKRADRVILEITRNMKKELKAMRDLRHDNLVSFIGACVEPGNVCIVSEYCTRGSLRDILDNEDVKLDNMFIASLVGDIIRGMIFLHDSDIRFHANLKASNCLVDSRWVLKIADFGLRDFRSPMINLMDVMGGVVHLNTLEYEDLLYRAPELLTQPDHKFLDRTTNVHIIQKSDIYSFSIILYELHLPSEVRGSNPGTRPYGQIGLSAREILERVIGLKECDSKEVPFENCFRPRLNALQSCYEFVKSCLRDSWQEDPDARPDFRAIRGRLRAMRKGLKANIFDNMISMMESYANNLESLVDDRTQLLIDEKRKTEALLFEMLPRTVAEQLRQGKRVDAESFDNVTIFFSDIVGFTAMSAESTPLQVVDFLNDLYTCFDSTIENFDVYKVETIGDAYMVASGLPVRNENRHAGEIASMALTLLQKVRRFKVRHKKEETLMLRSGIHSGPVCAGVVGRKMPRYCLFGDTVNTASRMESTGLPLKIHCSSSCREILLKLGGYILEERGIINLKGKGDLMTYWLVGEESQKKAQRMSERARSLKQRSPNKMHASTIDLFRVGSSAQRRRSTRSSAPRLHVPQPQRPGSPMSHFRYRSRTSAGGSIAEETPGMDRMDVYEWNSDVHGSDFDEHNDVFISPASPSEFAPTPQGAMSVKSDTQELSVLVPPRIAKRNSCPCIEKGESETIFIKTPSYKCSTSSISPLPPSISNQDVNELKVPDFSTAKGIKSVCHASLSSIVQHISLRDETEVPESFKRRSTFLSRLDQRSIRESLRLSKFMRKSKCNPGSGSCTSVGRNHFDNDDEEAKSLIE